MCNQKKKTLIALVISLALICSLTACSSTNDANNNTTQEDTSDKCPASDYGNHKWMAPTCIEPATCFWCDAYKDDKLSDHHNWNVYDNGLTQCVDCNILREDWLRQQGLDEQEGVINNATSNETDDDTSNIIATSNETINDDVATAKTPKVTGKSFNLTDRELIDWLNDTGKFEVGYTDIGDLDNGNTLYPFQYDDETGGLLLNHGEDGEDGKVCAIMVYFDDWNTSVVIAAWIGEQIDSDFSADDSFIPMANGESYTKAAMTLVDIDDIVTLVPSEYLADILE